jgi:hypothetical protein
MHGELKAFASSRVAKSYTKIPLLFIQPEADSCAEGCLAMDTVDNKGIFLHLFSSFLEATALYPAGVANCHNDAAVILFNDHEGRILIWTILTLEIQIIIALWSSLILGTWMH